MIGSTIGRYKILAKLGEGGMGVVYRAMDTRLEREVALKFLPTHRLTDPEVKTRFEREAKAAAALNHPNICTIHEVDEADGKPFIAMELVRGETLSEKIEEGPLKIDQALDIAAQAARGLAAAHEAGIVHRDIKSANIMVVPERTGHERQVKLMDFGLAQLSTAHTQLTKEGTTLGTMAYMAPEQAEGGKVDRRADIWALGVVLYEMTAGRQPFQGEYEHATVYSILNEQPEPLTAIRTGVPQELERIVNKALAKDTGARYQSADDMLVDLRALKKSRESAERAPSVTAQTTAQPKGASKGMIYGGAAAIVALAAVFIATRGNVEPPAAPVFYEPTQLTSYPGSEYGVTFSPDGSQIAFAWKRPDKENADIYVQVVGSANPIQLTDGSGWHFDPKWSPDGRMIAFVRYDDQGASIRLASPLGGPVRTLHQAPERGHFEGISWSPDSKTMAASIYDREDDLHRIYLIPVEGGESRLLVDPTDLMQGFSSYKAGDTEPTFFPDGERVLFLRQTAAHDQNFMVQSLNGGGAKTIPVEGFVYEYTLSPDGSSLVYESPGPEAGASLGGARLYRMALGDGEPAVIPGVGPGAVAPAWSSGGNQLAFSRTQIDVNLYVVELSDNPGDSPSPTRLASSTRSESLPRISPDGKRVTFLSDRSGGEAQLWVCNSDGSNLIQLTSFGEKRAGSPNWSPDGRRIAFDAMDDEGLWQVFVLDADGGPPRKMTSGPARHSRPSWSPDGAWIYFSRLEANQRTFWKAPADGGDPVPVSEEPVWGSEPSPDGRFVYYWDRVESVAKRIPVAGGEAETLPTEWGLRDDDFVIDGQGRIYYHQRDSESRETGVIRRLDPATGETADIFRVEGELGGQGPLSISADGRRLAYHLSDVSEADLMMLENFR